MQWTHRGAVVLVLLLAASPASLRAADPPAPAPAGDAPQRVPISEMEPLIDGSIRYVPPPSPPWKLIGKTDDNLKATYMTEDGQGRIDINVSPQDRDVPPEFAAQMARIIGKGILADAQRAGREFLKQPRVEKDPRFFLKVHDRQSGEHGVSDRLQLYRVIGLNIVHVAVTALAETPEQAEPIHAAAETLLDGMRLTRGQTPVYYPRNQLKIKPPIDWEEQKTDAPNGLVVTYTDPDHPARRLIIRARVIPKVMRDDPARLDAFVERMIDDERRQAPFPAAKPVGEDQALPAAAAAGGARESLRHVRTDAEGKSGERLRVQTRYFVINDVLVSLRSISTPEDEQVLKIADALAEDVGPIRE